jgi:hypothetical protein
MKVWQSIATVAIVLAITAAAPAGGPKGGHGHKGHGGHHGHNGHQGHHHGHTHHGHAHHGHIHQHYHKQYGHAFKHGWYYKGYTHKHWKHCYWDVRYGCYLYYDPYAVGYYYWCAPDNCYYPVGYAPYKKYGFTPTVKGSSPPPRKACRSCRPRRAARPPRRPCRPDSNLIGLSLFQRSSLARLGFNQTKQGCFVYGRVPAATIFPPGCLCNSGAE